VEDGIILDGVKTHKKHNQHYSSSNSIGCSAHLAYHVHNSGRKTSIIQVSSELSWSGRAVNHTSTTGFETRRKSEVWFIFSRNCFTRELPLNYHAWKSNRRTAITTTTTTRFISVPITHRLSPIGTSNHRLNP